MAASGRLLPAAFEAASVRYRRVLVVAGGPVKVPSQSDLLTSVTLYREPQPTPWRAG
jgi:hypothetical protein